MHQTVTVEEVRKNISGIKKKIAVMSGKGGVGKSTVTALLAISLAKKGSKVAVFDADFLGPSVPKLFGMENERIGLSERKFILPETRKYGIKILSIQFLLPERDTPVIWRGPMIIGVMNDMLAKTDWDGLDYLIFDLPPGTGDAPLTLMQSVELDGVIIVTSPNDLTSMIVEKALNMAKMMNTEVIGIVENMSYFVCPHCGERTHIFGEKRGEKLARKYGLEVIAEMPIDPELPEFADLGEIESYGKDYFSEINL